MTSLAALFQVVYMSSVISASSVDIILTLMSHLSYSPLNPRRACTVKVTVVPCVCVCVCVCVCLSVDCYSRAKGYDAAYERY